MFVGADIGGTFTDVAPYDDDLAGTEQLRTRISEEGNEA